MKVERWAGGLQTREINAIEKIEKAFSEPSARPLHNSRGGSLQDQLRGIKGKSIFPWKGYAGFRFVDSRGNEGEFDLVIVTHCNVLIIELKDWNNGEITSKGDKWYKGNYEMGRSPVSVTRNKKFLMEKKLAPFKKQFSNKDRTPFVHFLVVMNGNAVFSKIGEDELAHTISLDDFLKLADVKTFNARFKPHPDSKVLNQDFKIFDDLFLSNTTKPKHIIVNGYKATELIFEHPNKVYREHHAISEVSKQDEALLRIWDFNKLENQKAKTQDGRFSIVSREREVLQFIKHHDHDLYKHCLRSLTSIQKDEITAEYSELYELPPGHFRFNEFIGKYRDVFSERELFVLAKLLVAKFADLHAVKIAHRDLGDHSIWIAPSKEVALSNFISAYHQPLGTVGDFRAGLSVNEGMSPKGMVVTSSTTPFQMDVYSLGLLVWHILQTKRISPKTIESLEHHLESSRDWYSGVVKRALDGVSYKDAGEFFEALQQSEPKSEENYDVDDAALEEYRRNISHSRQFRDEVGFIVETDEKEIYRSNNQLVKAWLQINPTTQNPALGYKVLYFCQRVSKLKAISPPYMPCIREFGIATKSSSLYLVSDIAEGVSWNQLSLADEEKKLNIIDRLITAVEHLHGLGISHGDLHPGNIIVDTTQHVPCVYLIDIPDFCIDADTALNHRYSPENIDSCTASERDNFAAMRMSAELLGITWGEESIAYPSLSKAISLELQDTVYGFRELGRFKDALISLTTDENIETIEIVLKGEFSNLTIYPDNGHLYAQVVQSKKDTAQAKLRFIGIGGSLDIFYCSKRQQFTNGLKPRERSSISKDDEDKSQLEFGFALKIVAGNYTDLNSLSVRLASSDEFKRAIDLTLAVGEAESSLLVPPVVGNAQSEAIQVHSHDETQRDLGISTAALWRAILKTESESHPYIEVDGAVSVPKEQNDQLIIPYKAEIDPLGQFNKSDVIEAFKVEGEKETGFGEVNLKYSALNEVRLTKLKTSAKAIKDSDIIFFRTKQDKASYDKRKDALERLLNKEGTISQLVDYFEPTCELPAVAYDIEVTDQDFSRYDRTDDLGNEIRLNDQQRIAFKRLLQNGPISILQGPPGTGKTEFIVSTVSYLDGVLI